MKRPDRRERPTPMTHAERVAEIKGRFGFDEQLLDDAGEELRAGLALACGDENSAANLVEDGRRALFIRRINDVRLERIDCL